MIRFLALTVLLTLILPLPLLAQDQPVYCIMDCSCCIKLPETDPRSTTKYNSPQIDLTDSANSSLKFDHLVDREEELIFANHDLILNNTVDKRGHPAIGPPLT